MQIWSTEKDKELFGAVGGGSGGRDTSYLFQAMKGWELLLALSLALKEDMVAVVWMPRLLLNSSTYRRQGAYRDRGQARGGGWGGGASEEEELGANWEQLMAVYF